MRVRDWQKANSREGNIRKAQINFQYFERKLNLPIQVMNEGKRLYKKLLRGGVKMSGGTIENYVAVCLYQACKEDPSVYRSLADFRTARRTRKGNLFRLLGKIKMEVKAWP
ncbi:MAG: hypothetical protein ACTSU5_12835 [Promethearchaeota archaeon]